MIVLSREPRRYARSMTASAARLSAVRSYLDHTKFFPTNAVAKKRGRQLRRPLGKSGAQSTAAEGES